MSFYTSLSGLKAAQTDLSAISNNVANVGSTGFKKSTVAFGDIFAAAPMQTTNKTAGQGVRVQGVNQQFTQGTIETTDKTLDLAITGEGYFTVKGEDGTISYTRNGAMAVDDDRYVVDTTGSRIQVFAVDADTGAQTTTASSTADLVDLQIPTTYKGEETGAQLTSVGVGKDGLVSAVYADGSTVYLGQVAMASFNNQEGLRQEGDAHWSSTADSGTPILGTANQGMYGAISSGSLEHSNVDITEELVALISAQRNFQANSKAIEAANTLTTTIVNLRT
ncbi:flagellar hook-basal body complex protein [Sphingobium sp. YR768]|jgi:flagellar hook protein FlgE|uniref:flagellar hook-basal body complex protein n=1 Tax=Sphingobium sp. YR768 TaxID=1884365 RepID=UPI0008CDA114|nr:flagellar hook-basal body complex protein [Sphingobium sp. YR768]SEQ59046.1 flagellar hook protein FlgE [Sphingobium sp. YR768]